MKKDSATRVLAIVAAVLGAIAVVGVLTFAAPCMHDDGSVSICHTAQMGIIAGGVAAAVFALVALAVKNAKATGALLVVAAVCGLFVALAPGVVFPLCMMDTMRCHVFMQPFAEVVGAAMAAVALIAGIRSLRAA